MFWYNECICCPYGYHIDLDFVRYCESISKEDKNRTGSIKRRKDRRRQRQSMEMLLGLSAPVLELLDKEESKSKANYSRESSNSPKKNTITWNFNPNDDFNDVVSDFERALQISKNTLTNNLPDVTAVSGSIAGGLSSIQDKHLKPDLDVIDIEGSNQSSLTLQRIREALAISLERTKKLELQVKLIPTLQEELVFIRKENEHLKLKLNQHTNELNTVNGNYFKNTNQESPKRSLSFSHVNNLGENHRKKYSRTPSKECGTMCSVLTRTIGVGPQYPHTKHAATSTGDYQNKCSPKIAEKILIQKGTQTVIKDEKRDKAVQTFSSKTNSVCQTEAIFKPVMTDVSTSAGPDTRDVSVQFHSNDTSGDKAANLVCEKCNSLKSLTEGPETYPIALSVLDTKGTSVTLREDEEEKREEKKTKTIGLQYDYSKSTASKYSQTAIEAERNVKLVENSTQYESLKSKNIDTKPSKLVTLCNCGSQLKEDKTKGVDSGSNRITNEDVDSEKKVCSKCSKGEIDTQQAMQKDSASKIPISTGVPEFRRYRRQDTYTKIPPLSPTSSSIGTFERSDLSPKRASTESIEVSGEMDQNLKTHNTKSSINFPPSTTVQVQNTIMPSSEFSILQSPTRSRKKTVPSKEMQGAMKVLNDYLQKNQTGVIQNQSAISIIQQEWFKVSSYSTAVALSVEEYLDAFENVSSRLLGYIVNMTDDSGNTALHYAVSHGNFDVVSILLDSKVCDINKRNKAGYTSVMLVSFAKVRSQTHANVVKRLFQLADVNIKASQHGQTALMLAVSHGRLDMVKLLLEAGADINIQDEDGSTALMCAAEHGHIEIVKHFLSQSDCDSSITDADGSTALKIAMEAGHRHIGVLLYAHERSLQKTFDKMKRIKSNS